MRSRNYVGALCFICLCIVVVPGVQARTWHVPSEVPTLIQAIDLADPGDVIELAVGRHKLAGREIFLKDGLIIRSDTGMPGGVILEETPCNCGDWRDCPVFIFSAVGGDPVTFDGITFRNFTLSCDHYPNNPVFHVSGGTLNFNRCTFGNFYKTAAWYDNGASGTFSACTFSGGSGCPAAVHFDGAQLEMSKCTFRGITWMEDCGQLVGNILRVQSGSAFIADTVFEDNGPLIHLVTVGPAAQLTACTTCFAGNATIWEGRVEGLATLDCCDIDPVLWEVVGDGELVIVDPLGKSVQAGKAMQIESVTWTDVKNLFQ